MLLFEELLAGSGKQSTEFSWTSVEICWKARSPTPLPWDPFFPLVREWGRSLVTNSQWLQEKAQKVTEDS